MRDIIPVSKKDVIPSQRYVRPYATESIRRGVRVGIETQYVTAYDPPPNDPTEVIIISEVQPKKEAPASWDSPVSSLACASMVAIFLVIIVAAVPVVLYTLGWHGLLH